MQRYRQLRDVGFTHEHNHVRDVLDHILVSEQFYDHSRRKTWSFQELRVWNDHVVPAAENPDRTMTDHGVIRATFRYDPS